MKNKRLLPSAFTLNPPHSMYTWDCFSKVLVPSLASTGIHGPFSTGSLLSLQRMSVVHVLVLTEIFLVAV